MAHYMQNLINVPVTGDLPGDPDFGQVYAAINQVAIHLDEIQEEVHFDGIRTEADGTVLLTLKGTPVSTAAMSSRHADAHLVLGDPR